MPNNSLRKTVIEQLRERVQNNVEDAKNLIEILTAMNEISEVDEINQHIHVDIEELEDRLHDAIREDPSYKKLEELEHHRYLMPRDHYKKQKKHGDVDLVNTYLQDKSEVDFRRRIRISKRGFIALYTEIKDDEVFVSKSGPAQRSVKYQMIVALTRLGMYGNGATNKVLGEYFSIGHGSVDQYVEHFIVAVLKLQGKYIQWPMGRERERVILRHHELFGLPECIGFMDGSLIPLHQTPTWHNELFWSRKHIHAIQSMVICDFDTRILFGATGHYGSANDSGVLNQSGFLDKLDTFFEGEQYVVADSAYAKTKWCVPIGKNFEHEPLTGSDIKFNSLLSSARVSIENCFGALKGRFASLEELRCQLKVEEDVDRHNRWIVTCFILHNFCLKHDDPAFMAEIIDYFRRTHGKDEHLEADEDTFSRARRSSKYGNFDTTDDSLAVPNISTAEGIEKWLAVKKYVLDKHHYNIEYLDALYDN